MTRDDQAQAWKARALSRLPRAMGWSHAPIDHAHYAASYGMDLNGHPSPEAHYAAFGLEKGFLPSPAFDPIAYIYANPSVSPRAAWAHARLTDAVRAPDYVALASKIPEKLWYRYPEYKLSKEAQDAETAANRQAAQSYSEGYETALNSGEKQYRIVAPSAHEFLDLLERPEPVSFVKVPHGFWDSLQFIGLYQDQLRAKEGSRALTDEQLWRLATRVTAAHVTRNSSFFTENFAYELFGMFKKRDFPEHLRLGLSFKGIPTADNRIWNTPDFPPEAQKRRLDFLEDLFPNTTTFWDGTLFKRWCISGDLSRVSDALKNRPIVLIASGIFRGLGDDLGWTNWRHLEIPPKDSHHVRYKLLAEIVDAIEAIGGNAVKPVVVAQTGGTLAFWYFVQLSHRFPSASLLDFGQAINIWRLQDAVFYPWLTTYGRQMIDNNRLEKIYGAGGIAKIVERLEIADV
ncbi:MAG: hypothetical protein AAGG56_11145 [Pseudomonadota bacterium]